MTTLTKKMAEDLTDYLQDIGIRVRYIHADIDTIERIEIIRELRRGAFDVLVGINLLREGLDLPEVSLVAILDADKEGYLRSERSLIQTIGRAARNVRGTVLMYADTMTESMRKAIGETNRRRDGPGGVQPEHGITPQTIRKAISDPLVVACEGDYVTVPVDGAPLAADAPRRSRGAREAHRHAARRDARGGAAARVRAGGVAARRDPRSRGTPARGRDTGERAGLIRSATRERAP